MGGIQAEGGIEVARAIPVGSIKMLDAILSVAQGWAGEFGRHTAPCVAQERPVTDRGSM